MSKEEISSCGGFLLEDNFVEGIVYHSSSPESTLWMLGLL